MACCVCRMGLQSRFQPRRSGSTRRAAASEQAVFTWGDDFAPKGSDDGEHLAGRVSVAEPPGLTATKTLRRSGGSSPPNGFGLLRHGRQRLGMDGRPIRAADDQRVLRAAARPRRGALPPPRDQGRLTPVRSELLPPIPASRTSGRGGRHDDKPHRLALCRSAWLTSTLEPGPRRDSGSGLPLSPRRSAFRARQP